ncbi:MAG: hypothetical protein JST54_05695 [Deltaproteobacteria bacterium]|nr:hypothetical protein [Deltaproteobacteria bacterium]
MLPLLPEELAETVEDVLAPDEPLPEDAEVLPVVLEEEPLPLEAAVDVDVLELAVVLLEALDSEVPVEPVLALAVELPVLAPDVPEPVDDVDGVDDVDEVDVAVAVVELVDVAAVPLHATRTTDATLRRRVFIARASNRSCRGRRAGRACRRGSCR